MRGKTQKKLPDLATSGYNDRGFTKKPVGGGFASDSDEYLAAQQLPMIKGGGSIHAQHVTDAYIMNNQNQMGMKNKPMKQQMGMPINSGGLNNFNSGFNQSKYISGNVSHHNNSQSPASQTFFKDNSSKNKQNHSLIGNKKGWPTLKKKTGNVMYVSPYSKNSNPK